MHELSIIQNMIGIVEDSISERGPLEIKSICIKVGEFSGVAPESLKFAFETVKEGTVLEKSEMKLDVIPFRARCENCSAEFGMEDEFVFICPCCASRRAKILSGRELFIESIQAEEV
ncbi:MAG: hydrogenase maturation nickel metallochaperone HypA [Elusimicrobiota bacterium]